MCSWRSCGNVLKKETRRRVWNAYKLERLSLRRDVISVSIIQTNIKNSLLRVSNLINWQNYWYSFSLCCIYSLFRAVVLAFSASLTGDVTSEIAEDDWEQGWDLTLYWMYCLQVEQLDRTRRKESLRKRLPPKRNESVTLGSTDAKFYFSSGLLEDSQLGICRLFHNEGRAWGGKGENVFCHIIITFVYLLFWTQACPEGMDTNGTHRSHARYHSYPIPQPIKADHITGVYVPYSSNRGVGSLRPTWTPVKVLWDGTYGFSSLSEKARNRFSLCCFVIYAYIFNH